VWFILKNKICIFAGTTEGRILAETLTNLGVDVTACVATEYGESLVTANTVIAERLDSMAMATLFLTQNFEIVVDCTHPYATAVTKNLMTACSATNTEYLRVNRDSIDSYTSIPDMTCAIDYLRSTSGNILSTIGSKELSSFAGCGFLDRLFVRVLPISSSLDACQNINLPPSHIIAMQGPFSYELNKAMIEALDIKILLTKDGGAVGGFAEKVAIAADLGLDLVVIRKPAQQAGVSLTAATKMLSKRFGATTKTRVSIISCGLGNPNLLTAEASEHIAAAELIIGAPRLIKNFESLNTKMIAEIYAEKIADIISNHAHLQNIAVLFSGDIGFYSGATKLFSHLTEVTVVPICGISSPVYLCSKLQIPWQDVKLVSLHAGNCNIVSAVRDHKKVFTLLGGDRDAHYLCETLIKFGFGKIRLYIGEYLSYNKEVITSGTALELIQKKFDSLTSALIVNDDACLTTRFGICDHSFVRVDNVPMTKAEVRAVSLSKLQLSPNSIVMDIGGGTGSVSVEIALNVPNGKVFTIEKNIKAIAAVRENKFKFHVDNLEIIEGVAPAVLEPLDAPTHAFIGGSSGNLKSIVDAILAKNASTRFVLNVVSLETLTQAIELTKSFSYREVVHMSVARTKEVGNYNLMMAANPIYIITFGNYSPKNDE